VREEKILSEGRPTAPLLPVRPGGFGKPLWQLSNQDARLARVRVKLAQSALCTYADIRFMA
jgi:hypothetical protein